MSLLETWIRPAYQRLLVNDSARLLARYLTPNQITLCALISGVLSGLLIAINLPMLAVTLLLLSGYFDCLDGTIARLTGQSSNFGTMLDITADRSVEFAIILGLFAQHPLARAWPSIILLGACFLCVTTFLVVGIFKNNNTQKGFFYDRGLIERPEAFVFFTLMILIPSHFQFLAWLLSGLILLTAGIRLYTARQL